jgi:hypothetical protein
MLEILEIVEWFQMLGISQFFETRKESILGNFGTLMI